MALNDTLALPVQDLGYYVSEDKEMHAILSKTTSLPYGIEQQIQLPAEFPASLDSPLVWRGDDMAGQQDDWIVHLSSLDINAIESALLSIKAQGVPPTSLSPELFPLPASLVKSMSDISAQCYEGRGFCVLRGLDPSKYSTEDNSLIFMGLASHVGSMRAFQDRKRQQVLCHVVNAAVKLKEEQVTQPGFTDREMSFHNDEGEILALYVKNTSHEGGRTRIASAWHVYNLLATHRPDIVKLLSQEWTQDTFQDYSKYPPKVAPFLHVADGRVFFNFSRYPFTGFGKHLKRNESLPPVTLAQSEALDVVQLLASNFSMPLPSCRGDILFMNNMALLHGREPFNEHGEELQRHLIKLELRDPKRSWTLPDTLTELWDKLYGTNTEDGRREEHCCLSYELGQEREWSKNG